MHHCARPLLLVAIILPLASGCAAVSVASSATSAAVSVTTGTVKATGSTAAALGRTITPSGEEDEDKEE
ncbi:MULTISPECIES: hypothetical protein [unclassified Thioalkalivibrio]|uniref:hypothetical protein n=1 Tax=unclassified Thioalkalivibrio TaxID=2621013 RepID=UPI000378C81B|nr:MULTISPECIES: hypothetical protein [unclassified Thioalkalivibrio]